MIANQGGHLRRPIQPSRTGLSIQELKAMTAQRMNQSAEAVMSSFPPNTGGYNNMKTSQPPPPLYTPTANNNSRSRRQASRAAATMYADHSDFEFAPQSHQPPAMTRVNRSTSPPHNPPPQTARIEKLPAHSLTVQELKELTRMRLAREAVGPSHSPSTDNDLDSESNIHHRKNSANSLLTFTTLESRGSGDRDYQNQCRSGTISPVSDSYTDDNDQFNYNGPTGSQHQNQSQHTGQGPSGQGIATRKPSLTYPPSQNNNRNSNFPPQGLKNGLNSSAPGTHSSSQSMHAQATAQMAMLMDHQRRDMRDPYQSKDEQGNGDQTSAMARLRIDQRAILQDRQNQQLRQQGLEDNNQKPSMQIRQQQLGDRRRVQNSPFNEGFDDYNSSSGQMSDRSGRDEFDEPNRQYDQRYRGSQSSLNGDLGSINDFRFNSDKRPDFAPPPIMGNIRKPQAMTSVYREGSSYSPTSSVDNSIPPPPPLMPPLSRGPSCDTGSNSPSSRHKSIDSPSSMRHKSALAIPYPGPRERTLSDVNSLAFQMAEACLDSNSNPSTPKFSHRTFPPGLPNVGGSTLGGFGGPGPDFLGQALRRFTSIDSTSSIGSTQTSSISPMAGVNGSLLGPRVFGTGPNQGQNQESAFFNEPN
mmetsp:Transcript_31296/g.29836  ORF Transcript_31296/g.29836 Transcript_31296/m.29836 type:complete len:640 (+) Transcript_31296:145-2064(+)